MRNVVLARVDDRLIHGEVITSFIPYYKANVVIVVDDQTAKDKFQTRVLQACCPKGVSIEIYDVASAAEAINKENNPDEIVIILSKTPIAFEGIINAGVDIKAVNIGGMGIRGERKPFIRNCAASPDEIASMKRMVEKGIDVYYRLVANAERIEIVDKLK